MTLGAETATLLRPSGSEKGDASVFWTGLASYLVNCAVGLLARSGGVRFGTWHHVLYAIVFTCTVLALIVEREPWLLLTVTALAAFPRARPSSPWHPTLAVVGLVGYVAALSSPS